MYQIEFRPETVKDLEKCDDPIAKRILKKIKWLAENFDFMIFEIQGRRKCAWENLKNVK